MLLSETRKRQLEKIQSIKRFKQKSQKQIFNQISSNHRQRLNYAMQENKKLIDNIRLSARLSRQQDTASTRRIHQSIGKNNKLQVLRFNLLNLQNQRVSAIRPLLQNNQIDERAERLEILRGDRQERERQIQQRQEIFNTQISFVFNHQHHQFQQLQSQQQRRIFRISPRKEINDYKTNIIKQIMKGLGEFKHSGQDKPCRICLQDIKLNEKQIYLFCFHSFHKSCVRQWFNQKLVCPVCLSDVKDQFDKTKNQSKCF